jgi:hypothetical protein
MSDDLQANAVISQRLKGPFGESMVACMLQGRACFEYGRIEYG